MDRARIVELTARENEQFVRTHPASLALQARARASMPHGMPMGWFLDLYAHGPVFAVRGDGATFTDVDGHRYLDFNLADISLFCGFAPEPVVTAVARRAQAASHFLLPTEDAIWVAENLSQRFGLPRWQFTLAATSANVEAMRVARVATERPIVVMFDGQYHGHADEMLFAQGPGGPVAEYLGVDPGVAHRVRLVSFNDPTALEAALAPGDVAAVLTEPALTNCGVIQPRLGFHEQLRRITHAHGTLLIIDETHTQICGPGGLTGSWSLAPDLVTLGKSVAGGIPFGAYGMSEELAAVFERPSAEDPSAMIATGGTYFANALSMAAARSALDEILTPSVYAQAAELGARLAEGIETVARDAGLPWRAHRLGPRSGYAHDGVLPRNAEEARRGFRRDVADLQRVYFANRGIWEAIYSAGPCVGITHTTDDVDRYLNLLADFVTELAA